MASPNPRASLSMNEMILGTYRDRPGMIDRLKGAAPLDTGRAEQFARYHADYESALKRGDEVAAGVADNAIDSLLAEARAARQQAEPAEPAPVSFDGGVRRPVSRREPMTMGRHIARELAAQEEVASRARQMADDAGRAMGRW